MEKRKGDVKMKKKKINLILCVYWNQPGFKTCGGLHLELVYLVTALVPSDTACLASSPGSSSLTAVCTSLLVIVERLLYWASLDASVAILSNRSFTKEFMMLMALLEIPVSGWTFEDGVKGSLVVHFSLGGSWSLGSRFLFTHLFQNFIDVHGVSLSSFGFSFRLFLTRTLPLLFGYIISHFGNGVTNIKCVKML